MANTAQKIAACLMGLGALVLAYEAGYSEVNDAPVDVQVIYEESGELETVTLYRNGKPVHESQVTMHEAWRGNEAGAAGLYYEDPAGPEQVHVSITYNEEGEAELVELTDNDGQDVPVGSVAEDFEAMYSDEYANTDAEEG